MIKHFLSYRLILLLLLSVGWSTTAFAQDPQFSQFYANPMYLNPALTGNTPQFRFSSTYRNQWPSIPKGYISYTAALDYNIEKIKSGVGLMATHDKAGSEGLRFTNLALLYSTYVRLSRLVYIKGGLRFSYTSRNINQSELLFSDQIIRDGAPASIEQIGSSLNHFDASSGLLLTHVEKYWFGFSLDHLNQPNYGFFERETPLAIKASFHGGWNFKMKSSGRVSKPGYIKTLVHYKFQDKWDQFDIGAYYEKDPMFVGMWYRGLPFLKRYENDFPNNESMVLLLGVKADDLRIGYSYDITISKLANSSGGAHEISLIYEVANSRKKRRRKLLLVPCPKF